MGTPKATVYISPRKRLGNILLKLSPWFIGPPIAYYIYLGVEHLGMSQVATGIVLVVIGGSCLAASWYILTRYKKGKGNSDTH